MLNIHYHTRATIMAKIYKNFYNSVMNGHIFTVQFESTKNRLHRHLKPASIAYYTYVNNVSFYVNNVPYFTASAMVADGVISNRQASELERNYEYM